MDWEEEEREMATLRLREKDADARFSFLTNDTWANWGNNFHFCHLIDASTQQVSWAWSSDAAYDENVDEDGDGDDGERGKN